MSYTPHQRLIAPARASRHPGRLIAGCIMFIALFMLLSATFSQLQSMFLSEDGRERFLRELASASTPLTALINLAFFGLMILALWPTLRLVHNRALSGLIGPWHSVRQHSRAVIWALILLYGVFVLLPLPEELRPSRNMRLDLWLLYLGPAMLALLIQVSAEELIFRGYLQSQLAARFPSPVIWMGVPSILFALLHYGNAGIGGYAWLIVIWAGAFGLAAADLTARSGTLGPAITLHFFNNFFAILLFAPEGSFNGLALYTLPVSMMDNAMLATWMPVELAVLLCAWLAARLALRC